MKFGPVDAARDGLTALEAFGDVVVVSTDGKGDPSGTTS